MIDFSAAREAMVDCQVRPSDVTRYPVIEAMLTVPREDYVPAARRAVAYLGEHVPLAPGRVVLDPRVFAKMIDALAILADDLVLDVGCGLGYSAAVIARMAEAVIGLEEDGDLASDAEQQLSAHGIDNAVLQVGPLADGFAEHGPFDAIIIEGGIEMLPEALADQLKLGGRIVAIFVNERSGQARLGTKFEHGIVWRRLFDASAPVLPGFMATKEFEF